MPDPTLSKEASPNKPTNKEKTLFHEKQEESDGRLRLQGSTITMQANKMENKTKKKKQLQPWRKNYQKKIRVSQPSATLNSSAQKTLAGKQEADVVFFPARPPLFPPGAGQHVNASLQGRDEKKNKTKTKTRVSFPR